MSTAFAAANVLEDGDFNICNNPFVTGRPSIRLSFSNHAEAEAAAKELSKVEGDIRLFRYRETSPTSKVVTGTETYRGGKRVYRSKGFKTLVAARTT